MTSSSQELQEKAEWLRKRIEQSIEKATLRTSENQRRATIIKITTILFAGTSTILLGLQITGFEKAFKDTAFVLGALITILSAAEPFFNYRALWVEHERAEYQFRLLKDDLEFYLAGTSVDKISETSLKAFHSRFQLIWSEVSQKWLEQRQSSRFNL
jgi:hypothetical protein